MAIFIGLQLRLFIALGSQLVSPSLIISIFYNLIAGNYPAVQNSVKLNKSESASEPKFA